MFLFLMMLSCQLPEARSDFYFIPLSAVYSVQTK